MKKKIVVFIAMLTFGTITLLAQAPPCPTGPGGTLGKDNGLTGAPIDGGMGIFLLLGAGYAAKRIFDARKATLSE